MKIYRKLNKLLFAGFLALLLVGCEYEYDQNYPPVNRPVATISPLNVTASEGDTVTFTVTLSKWIDNVSSFKVTQMESSSDFKESETSVKLNSYGQYKFGPAGYLFEIPNLTTKQTFQVVIGEDIIAEGQESVTYRFIPVEEARSAVKGGEQHVTINIQNSEEYKGATSADLGIKVDWRGEDSDVDFSLLDYDVILAQGGALLAYISGTGNVPEVGVVPSALPDGTYQILVDYYDNGGLTGHIAVPMTITASNIGLAQGSKTYEELFFIDDSTNGAAYAITLIGEIQKSGTSYTVTDANGNVIYQTP